MNKLIHLTAALLISLCASQSQATDGAPPDKVQINGVRDPLIQPYRIMAAGFTAMEKHRALAPNVSELKFMLSPRSIAPAGVMEGLTLRLDGDSTNVPLPIGADGVFTLPRNESAANDNAKLILNRKQNFIRWAPHVRTPGVPAGFVRLGDARMECHVLVGVVKKLANFVVSIALNSLMGTDWCASDKFHAPTFTGKRIVAASLIHGEERIPLQVDENGISFYAPITDARYSNDDLVELTYAALQ